MRVCGECHKPLEGSATRCPFCGSNTVSYMPDRPVEPEQVEHEESSSGQGITIVFDKGHDTPTVAHETTEGEHEHETEILEIGEETHPWVEKLLNWAKQPRTWMIAGGLLVALGGGAWWMLSDHKPEVQEVHIDPRAVDPVMAKEFSKMVDSALVDKLEWGKEVMKKRTPFRFPEELMMKVDREKPEIHYVTDEKVSATYRFSIAYHFKETHEKLYPWTTVTFFFELRGGKWIMVGERWPREAEVVFE